MEDLIIKLRLPSTEAADLIETRWKLVDNPRCLTYRLGTLYQADGTTESAGYHVDYLLTGISDVPQAWRKYMVAPEFPKHALSGREADALAHAELAPAQLADLAAADLSLLVPTDEEAAELAGNGRTTDLEDAAARLTLRLAIIEKRIALEAARTARDADNAQIDAAQADKDMALAALSTAQAEKTAALADRDAAQAIIDNPASTGPQKQAARADKASALDRVDAANAAIASAQADRDAANDQIAAGQASKAEHQAEIDALRAEIDTLKAQRT